MLTESFLLNIGIYLFIFFVVNWLLINIWQKNFNTKKFFYRLFLVPGIIIHELSHLLACWLTGAKVQKISFFALKGGYVKHLPAKIPIIGQFLISFVPILGGLGMIMFFSWIFNFWNFLNQRVNYHIDFLFFWQTAFNFLQQNWLTWQVWLFIYLIISISICLRPSWSDLKNGALGLVIIFVLLGLLYYFNLFPTWLINLIDKFNIMLVFVIFIQFFVLLLSLPFYLIKKLFINKSVK